MSQCMCIDFPTMESNATKQCLHTVDQQTNNSVQTKINQKICYIGNKFVIRGQFRMNRGYPQIVIYISFRLLTKNE